MLTALRQAVAEDAIRLRGLMSHLVYADQPDNPINDVQAQRFTEMLAQAREQGVRFEVAHLSNSSATMSRPDLAFDLVRPGIAVYGLSPVPELGDMGLIPAMTVKCTVALVKSVRAGEGVSYGHTWIARARHHGGADADRLRRRRLPVAGRPAGRADQRQAAAAASGGSAWTSSSSTWVPGPSMSPRATRRSCSGPAPAGEPTAQDWADLLGTIHYEVVTSPRGRITRTYREAETVER